MKRSKPLVYDYSLEEISMSKDFTLQENIKQKFLQ